MSLEGSVEEYILPDVVDTQSDEIQQELDLISDQLNSVKYTIASVESAENSDVKQNKINEIDGIITTTKQKIETLENDTTLSVDQRQVLEYSKLELTTLEKKIKPWYEKMWDFFTEKSTKIRNYAQENPGKTAIIATGIWAIGLWLWSLFKKDTKKEGVAEEKWFWDTWYGKALKWTGIGAGAYTLIDRFMTGKRWRDKEVSPNDEIEDLNKKFNELDINKKEQYNAYGSTVNDFYTDIYSFSDGTVPSGMNDVMLWSQNKKLDAMTWVIPFMLDETFGNISDMNDEVWLFSLDVSADAHEIWKKIAWLVGNGAGNIAQYILSMVGFEGLVDPKNIENQVVTFLTWSDKIEDTKLIFRKILKVISFTNYAENILIKQKADALLSTGEILYKKWKPTRDGEDVSREKISYNKEDGDLMNDILTYPDRYKIGDVELSSIRSEVRSNTISELSSKVGTINTEKVWMANSSVRESIAKINDERDQRHKDLEKDKIKTLDEMKDNVEDELAGSFWSRMQRGMPLFHLLDFGWAAEGTKESLKKHAGFQKLISQFKWEFDKLKSETDTSVIKNKIDMYYATIKEIAVAEFAVDEIADENWNIGARIGMNIKNMFFGSLDNIRHGFVLFSNGYELEWSMYILSGALPFYLLWTSSGRTILMKSGKAVISTTARASMTTISAVSGRVSLSANKNIAQILANNGLGRFMLRNSMFAWEAGKNLFKYYYLTGGLSTNAANALVSSAKREGRAWDVFQYLKDLKVIRSEEDVRILQRGFADGRDYLSNKSFRELLFKTADASMRSKIFSPQSIPVDANVMAFEQLKKFEEKCAGVGKNTKQFLDDFVKNWSINNIDELKNIVANIDKIDESKLVGKSVDQLAMMFKDMRSSITSNVFSGVVEHTRSATEIADIARVKTKLNDALTIEWDTLIKLNKRQKQGSITKLNTVITESNIKKLEVLVSELDTIEPKQLLLFEHLLSNTGDTVKAVKILEVLWNSPEWVKAAEKLFAWNMDEFVAILQSSGLLKKAGITDDVLQWFAKWLKFASHMDEALDMTKAVLKILSKVH